MALASLLLALCALCCCVYLWLELQRRPLKSDVAPALKQYSEELSKTYDKQLRAIETEWTEMYQKFQRIMGRADKIRGLESPPPAQEQQKPLTRSDILRSRRGL